MSKVFVNKMIAELIARGSTSKVYKEARKESDASGTHAVSVYKSSLKHYESDVDIEQAYNVILNRCKKEFKDSSVTDDGVKITVVMPERYSTKLIGIVRDAMMVAEKKDAHFAHSGDTTVGIRILARSAATSRAEMMRKAKNVDIGVRYSKKKAVLAFQAALEETLNEANWSWTSDESLTALKYLKNIAITGSIVPAKFNKAGSEELDLSKLKVNSLYENFEKAFIKELKMSQTEFIKKFGTMSASPSPVEKISSKIINDFVEEIKSPIKTSDLPPKVTAKSDKSKVPKRRKKVKKAPTAKVEIHYKKSSEQSIISLKKLIPQLNAGLADTVARNMHEPALVNRTGRFASSVKIVDITRTPKGYPSISYTYQQDPYKLFEHPGGDPRRATEDRDPRSIINQSIREKAAGIIQGRFYTRRL